MIHILANYFFIKLNKQNKSPFFQQEFSTPIIIEKTLILHTANLYLILRLNFSPTYILEFDYLRLRNAEAQIMLQNGSHRLVNDQ